MKNNRIVLVDEDALTRDFIRLLLDDVSNLDVVAEADNGPEAVRLAKEFLPDVVIMDLGAKGAAAIETITRIVRHAPKTKVIMISMNADKRFLMDAINAGASGFVHRNFVSKEIVAALRSVADTGFFLSPSLKPRSEKAPHERQVTYSGLSVREQEILAMFAEGKDARKIAFYLQLTPKVVEAQRIKAMKKLGLKNLHELTMYALREGLLSANDG